LGVPIFARATYEIHPESYEVTLGDPQQFRKQFLQHQAGQVLEISPGQTLVGPHGSLLALVDGCLLEVPEISSQLQQPLKVRLTKVSNSYLRGSPA